MIEISEGEILVDGRNITRVALPELRSKLAIIPQDPILFTGSIRYGISFMLLCKIMLVSVPLFIEDLKSGCYVSLYFVVVVTL